jgi:hypothetical protein
MRFVVFLLLILEIIKLTKVLFLGERVCTELLIAIPYGCSLSLIDETVIQVSQVGQLVDDVVLIIGFLSERVSSHVEHLEVLEFHLFSKVEGNDFIGGYLVVADAEHVEQFAIIKPFELTDLIVVERQIS